jgi:hypothetical protein
MGRSDQGRKHLDEAFFADASISQRLRQCYRDIATYALWAAKIEQPQFSSEWRNIGYIFIKKVVADLPFGWNLSSKKAFAQFMITIGFDTYAGSNYSSTIRYLLRGASMDLYWISNLGFLKIFTKSILRM